MSHHVSKRVHHHSILFWLTPALLLAAVGGTVFYFQPRLKDLTDHAFLLLRLLFI